MELMPILIGSATLVVAAILIEAWLKRGKAARPLAQRMKAGMPETADTKKPLGMEATDLESVERAQKLNEIVALKSTNTKFR